MSKKKVRKNKDSNLVENTESLEATETAEEVETTESDEVLEVVKTKPTKEDKKKAKDNKTRKKLKIANLEETFSRKFFLNLKKLTGQHLSKLASKQEQF